MNLTIRNLLLHTLAFVDTFMERGTVGEPMYLIRYGVMGHVGRFCSVPESCAGTARGEIVVIQSDRGTELGEILIRLDEELAVGEHDKRCQSLVEAPRHAFGADRQRVLRRAGPEDLARAAHAQKLSLARFDNCRLVLEEEEWHSDLIDVESLLDESTVVLLYLGPRPPDEAFLRSQFRVACKLDVVFERIGPGVDDEQLEAMVDDERAGDGCGSCDCDTRGGGCGVAARAQGDDGPCSRHFQPGALRPRVAHRL